MELESRKSESYLRRVIRKRYNSSKKALKKFWPVKIFRLIFVIFSLIPLIFVAKDSDSWTITDADPRNTRDGYIVVNGSFRPIVANNAFEWIMLAIARATAFAMYPDIFVIFFSKCRATIAFLSDTPISMFLFRDMHDVHAYCGKFVATMVALHTIFHIIRWSYAGNISLIYASTAGITGFIAVYVTPFITYVMMSDRMRSFIRFEIRKGLHYLFYIFAVGLCYHVPTTALPWGGYIRYVFATCIIWYTLDAMYVHFFLTERCSTPMFQVSPNGVQMKARVSPKFYQRLQSGGYTYVCLPWIDKNQWHAFSLYEYPGETDTAYVFMENAGDWTASVHKALQRETSRPVWLCGPFPSPYNNADLYDNQILIASGIGITPAMSALNSLRNSRRINIIWMVRDPHMLDFFTKLMNPDDEAWFLIFYTGKVPISDKYEKFNTNIRIVKKRPDLEMIITNLVYGVESGYGLPERAVKCSETNMLEALKGKIQDLDGTGMTTSMKMTELMKYAERYGFELTPLMNELNASMKRSVTRERFLKDIEQAIIDDANAELYNIYDDNYSELDDDESMDQQVAHNAEYDSAQTELLAAIDDLQLDADIQTVDEEMGFQNNVSAFDVVSENKRGIKRESSMKVVLSDRAEPPVSSPKNGRAKRRASYTLQRNSSAMLADPTLDHGNIAKDYVKRLLTTSEGKHIVKSWGLLYCGGNVKIRKNLKQISRDYMLDLNTECFRW